MSDRLLTVAEVAELMRVTVPRAYELARNGVIPTVRLGRQIRVDPEQLRRVIEQGGKPLPGGWRREA